MIDKIQYDNGYSAVVFDEPFKDYYTIMLDAVADTSHRRSGAYNRDILKDCLFCVMFYYEDEPYHLFGMDQEPWMKNVARGFYRGWKKTDARDIIGRELYSNRRLMNFYRENPQYHKKYGIDTVFVTRSYHEEKSENAFEGFLNMMQTKFVRVPGVYLYKNTPQMIYVDGDDSFIKNLPKYK